MLSKLAPVYAPRAAGRSRTATTRRRARRAVLPDGAPARRDPAQGPARRARRRPRDARRVVRAARRRARRAARASTTPPPGLGDFGKPDGLRRAPGAAAGPSATHGSQTDDIPAMTEVARVARRAPARRRRAGADPQRLQVRQRDPRSRRSSAITGVLDWEMATVGDPLMDLGTSLSYWVAGRRSAALFQQLPFGADRRSPAC